jgi:hypothetical protein
VVIAEDYAFIYDEMDRGYYMGYLMEYENETG